MKNNQFRGVGVALVTPFDEFGNIDVLSLKNLVDFVINHGVDYLVVLGTTGESSTLTENEKAVVRQTITYANNGRVPQILGIGGNNTNVVCQEISRTDLSSFQAILSVSPYYNKPSQEGIKEHYKKLAHNSKLDIIIYNVPGRTSSNILIKTVLSLHKSCKNIIGIKEAGGNFDQMQRLIVEAPNDFLVISGDDNLAPAEILMGADGVISVIGQGLPNQYCAIIDEAIKGNVNFVRRKFKEILPITNYIFEEGNPTGIKNLLFHRNICSSSVRLPLVKASNNLSQKIKDELKNLL